MESETASAIDRGGFYDPDADVRATSHGNLPHWHQSYVYVFVTWRIGDALPRNVIAQLSSERARWLADHPMPWTVEERQEYGRRFAHRADRLLDKGIGSCILRFADAAALVGGALRYFDGERYLLDSYVVMPNHVHVLVGLSDAAPLATVVHSWKSFTANKLRPYSTKSKTIWQEGYWDRLVRSSRHLRSCRAYIQSNPVKAALPVGQYEVYSRFPPGGD